MSINELGYSQLFPVSWYRKCHMNKKFGFCSHGRETWFPQADVSWGMPMSWLWIQETGFLFSFLQVCMCITKTSVCGREKTKWVGERGHDTGRCILVFKIIPLYKLNSDAYIMWGKARPYLPARPVSPRRRRQTCKTKQKNRDSDGVFSHCYS